MGSLWLHVGNSVGVGVGTGRPWKGPAAMDQVGDKDGQDRGAGRGTGEE